MIKCLSKISSILPFSLFEILIYILFIVFLILLSCLIYNVIKNPKKILYFFKDFILNIISIMGVIYFLFIILWGITALARQVLEPKLIGEGAGIPPVLSLFAMYAGIKLFGGVGAVFSPLAVSVIATVIKDKKEMTSL